ncbi:MAG: indole-3-glycerol phosphate synthase TrpC [Pyrinomonadaceae bacterium]
MTILDKIIVHKRREVAHRRKSIPPQLMRQSELFNAPRKSFVKELNRPDKVGIIAEFKRRSPSQGWIKEKANVFEIAKGYEAAGASALSVLTDSEFFGGSNVDLINAFLEVEIPILRKDFIVDKHQILEARDIGASAILLIAAALNEKEIKEFAHVAAELELEVLLEIHSLDELPDNLDNISAIGVNNRDLRDFSVDINRSLKIVAKLPAEITKISESGLADTATILELKQAGFSGFLIGETFMKTADPAAACAELIKQLKTL